MKRVVMMPLFPMTSNRRPSFTLPEVLLAVGVAGLLLGLLAPMLRRSRERAGEVATLMNLRSLGQTYELAVLANRSIYPFPPMRRSGEYGPLVFQPPGDPNATLHFFGSVFYWGRTFWPALLHNVAPWPEHYGSWLSPGLDMGDDDGPLWVRAPTVSYRIAECFYASPQVWTPGVAVTERMIAPVNQAVVAYPGAKVLAYDGDRAYLRLVNLAPPRPVLFADGAAALKRDGDSLPTQRNPLTNRAPERYHDTRFGAAGRDF